MLLPRHCSCCCVMASCVDNHAAIIIRYRRCMVMLYVLVMLHVWISACGVLVVAMRGVVVIMISVVRVVIGTVLMTDVMVVIM